MESAQLDAVWLEYAYPMLAGIVSYEDGIDELINQLNKAGWDNYVAEI